MHRVVLVALVLASLAECKQTHGDRPVRKYSWKPESVPADAREVSAGTFFRTVKINDAGPAIETLPEFGYAETINPTDGSNAVTSLEAGSPATIPTGLRLVFAGARIGETRQAWSCKANLRSNCRLSEYTYYRQPR
jgi:hypothetical protein